MFFSMVLLFTFLLMAVGENNHFSLRRSLVANDECTSAISIASNSVTSGSTTGATADGLSYCGTDITAPGVWYTFVGTGNQMALSTCNDEDPATGGAGYDSKITVYSGSCASLICVAGVDDYIGCSGYSTYVSPFDTHAGVEYFVLVHGYGSAIGNFDLALIEVLPLDSDSVPNDECSDAEVIAIDSVTSGSTLAATIDDSFPHCGASIDTSGVWYKFTGNGNRVRVSTCVHDYDTKISVYCGSCLSPSCVGGNDDYCDLGSGVEFDAVTGVDYWVLVHGYGGSKGDFALNVEDLGKSVYAVVLDYCTV